MTHYPKFFLNKGRILVGPVYNLKKLILHSFCPWIYLYLLFSEYLSHNCVMLLLLCWLGADLVIQSQPLYTTSSLTTKMRGIIGNRAGLVVLNFGQTSSPTAGAHLIFVTTITTAGCVKILAKCKIFQLEREKNCFDIASAKYAVYKMCVL